MIYLLPSIINQRKMNSKTEDALPFVAATLAAFSLPIIVGLYFALKRCLKKSRQSEPPLADTRMTESITLSQQPEPINLLSAHSLRCYCRPAIDSDLESLAANRTILFETDFVLPEYVETGPGPPDYEMTFMPTSSLHERADLWPQDHGSYSTFSSANDERIHTSDF